MRRRPKLPSMVLRGGNHFRVCEMDGRRLEEK